MNDFLKGKRVFVTGACGTVGHELVRQLLEDYQVEELVGVDNSESALFFLEQEFLQYPQATFFLADVRDKEKLTDRMRGMDIVFHTAAFKHVILCERSPMEAVQTNILGVQNVICAALQNNVERVIFTSSDKAVNPTNVMGTSKLMGERLMSAASSNLHGDGPIFASTRFGNVLGSHGSVIPIFREQIRQGGPVTLTDPNMTRFIMSINEAVKLVIDSSALACGGEIFVTKMPVIWVKDLAEVMIQELAYNLGKYNGEIGIQIIGVKPGEKMYEELLNYEETRRSWELDRYFVVLPAFRGLYRKIQYTYPEVIRESVDREYNSANQTPLSKEQLLSFLKENELLLTGKDDWEHPAKRYWLNGRSVERRTDMTERMAYGA